MSLEWVELCKTHVDLGTSRRANALIVTLNRTCFRLKSAPHLLFSILLDPKFRIPPQAPDMDRPYRPLLIFAESFGDTEVVEGTLDRGLVV